MRLPGAKTKLALAMLLIPAGYGAYWVSGHIWARRHFQAAEESLAGRDFRRASHHLSLCLTVWPRDHAARLLAAQTARRSGDLEGARRELRLHERHKGPAAARLLERRLLDLQEGNLADTDDLLESCASNLHAPSAYLILEAIISENVKALELAYTEGMTLMEGPSGWNRTQTERAIALWRQRHLGPADQAQAHFWRARIQRLINPQEAATELRRALELNPDHDEARLYLADTMIEFDARHAIDHLQVLRRRDPGNEQVSVLLAVSHRSLGQFLEAQQALDDVLATSPDHGRVLLERGKVALDAGKPDDAEAFLRRALALTPNEPFVHLALSRCLHLNGKVDEANRYQQRYGEIEAERARTRGIQAEQERIAWRHRLEKESLQKSKTSVQR